MSSPFPGMDPYLEERSIWPDVHASFITYVREDLQPQVRPKYVARIGERIQLAEVRHSYIPDVFLVHRLREPAPVLATAAPLVVDEPQTITYLDEERHVPYIEIINYFDIGNMAFLIQIGNRLWLVNNQGGGRSQYRSWFT